MHHASFFKNHHNNNSALIDAHNRDNNKTKILNTKIISKIHPIFHY